MASVGARDRAEPRVERDPAEARLRQRYYARRDRKTARANAGGRPRIEEAETIDEALDIAREEGRAEGAAQRGPAAPTPPPSASPSSPRGIPVPQSGGSLSVSAPFAVEVILISIDEIANQRRAPLPSRLLVAGLAFGILAIPKGEARRPAALFAWSLVIATFYAGTSKSTGAPAALGPVKWLGDFVSGKYGKVKKGVRSAPGNPGTSPPTPPPPAGGSGGRLNR